mgnify:FL=1|tara:strand:- start:130 stop:363 length:234 start_codon:yes stop_codon:yes gene_type:complete
MITSNKDDTLETILEKIQTPDDLKGKLGVYTMFRMTKRNSINQINMYIQLKDPKLWEEIKKVYYPSFFDKIKKTFGF